MLSYQHGFHAGNVGDVLKHTVLCEVIAYLRKKDKPFYFHDTHAGRGLYDLTLPMANKTSEYLAGIARIWRQANPPSACLPYLSALGAFNRGDALRYYAGSSLLARQLMRTSDRLVANELHPQEFRFLQQQAEIRRERQLPRLRVSREDGFAALKAALPPKEHRGVVLIDPSYEQTSDDRACAQALNASLQRFATGVYLLWYPIVELERALDLADSVKKLGAQAILRVELLVRAPVAGERGMVGSGMLILNPTWQLDISLQEALPWLVRHTAPETGRWHLDWLKRKD